MVISVAGNVDHAQVVRQIREVFADRLEPSVDAAPARPVRKRRWKADTVRILSQGDRAGARDDGNTRTGPRRDERRYAAAVLSTALGGGMSSAVSKKSAKSAAWRTPSTPTPSRSPTPASSAFTPDVCRRKRTR